MPNKYLMQQEVEDASIFHIFRTQKTHTHTHTSARAARCLPCIFLSPIPPYFLRSCFPLFLTQHPAVPGDPACCCASRLRLYKTRAHACAHTHSNTVESLCGHNLPVNPAAAQCRPPSSILGVMGWKCVCVCLGCGERERQRARERERDGEVKGLEECEDLSIQGC